MTAALINHLWQSTLFAAAAGLLTLLFRRNGAGVRYGLWFAASLKFLIPFALLTAVGGFAAQQLHLSLPAPSSLQAIAPVIEPFTPAPAVTHANPAAAAPPATLAVAPRATPHPLRAPAVPFDPAPMLFGVWALGLAAVLLIWTARWSRVRGALRAARPASLPAPVPVLSTPFPIEPGVVGVWRPWVIVPDGLDEELAPAEWKAVLAHELCHIRRRDNLTGAIHMLTQALFWFHPLVWWLGDRLVAERERACDEAVVRGGFDARAYAWTILKVCRLYVPQPLVWAAGVSGSNLVARVEAIVKVVPSPPLSRAKKALLLAAGAGVFATPVAAGMLSSPEAQQAVARAAAITSKALGVSRADPMLAAAPDRAQVEAATPIVLTRGRSIERPALTIASLDAAQVRLTRDLAAPQVQATPVQAQASAFRPAAISDARQDAFAFVQSYAAYGPKRERIARWIGPLCLRVVGLVADQEDAVRARIAEVAKGVGLEIQQQGTRAGTPRGCRGSDIEIGFTTDPQATLDDVAKHHRSLLGSGPGGVQAATAMTQPIQAWYVTSGVDLAAYDVTPRGELDAGDGANSLKVPVVYQTLAAPMGNGGFVGETYATATNQDHGTSPAPTPFEPMNGGSFGGLDANGFRNVIVIVDLRRSGTVKLGLIADYVAMLALSQPRSPDHCQALPSITDLFAGPCPGRAPPGGLTPADAAYLTALYSPSPRSSPRSDRQSSQTGSASESGIADRMGEILGEDGATADAAGAGRSAAQPRG